MVRPDYSSQPRLRKLVRPQDVAVVLGVVDELQDVGVGAVVTNSGHRTEDARTQRALTEEMDVWLSQEGGIYGVQKGASGSIYEVDVVSETCSCPDWQTGEPDGGCKHLRRVDMEIRAGRVPRPDGRLTESAAVIELPAEEAGR